MPPRMLLVGGLDELLEVLDDDAGGLDAVGDVELVLRGEGLDLGAEALQVLPILEAEVLLRGADERLLGLLHESRSSVQYWLMLLHPANRSDMP